jgi:uroporphyrinogen-III synthase
LRIPPTSLDNCNIIAIGPATSKALRQHGVSPDFMPKEYTSKSLITLLSKLKRDQKILIPCSDRSLWHSATKSMVGSKVSTPTLYRNSAPNIGYADNFLDLLTGNFSGIVFTSPSTVDHLCGLSKKLSIAELLQNKVVACIGPTTTQACIDRKIDVTIQPRKYTITALMWSIVHHFQAQKSETT